ncbi:hypothetical protein ACQEU6_24880 [Spirillospora sp. CA-108201]
MGVTSAIASPATGKLPAQEPPKPPPGPYEFGSLTATDGLGRTLPQFGEVRAPRTDRYVGIFYPVWLGQHGTSGPYDITQILENHPEAVHDSGHPAWGPVGAMHHWGEPLFDYYFSDDAWVLRRDAQMLADAQVDFLVIDQTNAFPNVDNMRRLMEVFDDVRRQGWNVPKIVFYTHTNSGNVIRADYEAFYKSGLFPELWFRWEGKPLIIGDPDQVSQEVRDFFTFRRDQWPNEPTKPLAFPWISFQKPQEVFYVGGEPEIVPVAAAVHNNFPFSDQPFYGYGDNWSRSFHDGALDPAPDAYTRGHQFTEQWERALQVDPKIVMLLEWNEWVAQRGAGQFPGWNNETRPPERPVFFVDCATAEFSRDVGPMKGGFNDNYYLQMVAFIRRYKGLGAQARPSARQSIDVAGAFDQWDGVGPTYRGFVGDAQPRDHPGFGDVTLTNKTGRNDFEIAKVARDAQHIYFYVRTAQPITGQDADKNWMTLFLNIDGDSGSGWEGYEFVVNRIRRDSNKTVLETSRGGWHWREVGEVRYRTSGRELHLAIPRSMLGRHAHGKLHVQFKWSDNMQVDGDVMDFYVNGDTAPYGRFSFLYTEDHQLTSPVES